VAKYERNTISQSPAGDKDYKEFSTLFFIFLFFLLFLILLRFLDFFLTGGGSTWKQPGRSMSGKSPSSVLTSKAAGIFFFFFFLLPCDFLLLHLGELMLARQNCLATLFCFFPPLSFPLFISQSRVDVLGLHLYLYTLGSGRNGKK
jgi:hypothetical protein